MEFILLTKPSITNLTNFLLTLLIVIQLLRGKGKSKSTLYLALALAALGGILFVFFVQYSVTGKFAQLASYTLVPIAMLTVVGHTQFAYHFPRNIYPRESRIIGTITFIALLYAIVNAAYYIIKSNTIDANEFLVNSIVISVFFIWSEILLFRKTIRFAQNKNTALDKLLATAPNIRKQNPVQYWMAVLKSDCQKLLRPKGKEARALCAFALLMCLGTLIPLSIFAESAGVLTGEAFIHIRDVLSLLYLFGFVWVYLDNGPEPSSFSTKMIALTITAMLLVLSRVSFVTLTSFEDEYYENRKRTIALFRDSARDIDFSDLPEKVLYVNRYALANDTLNPSYTTLYDRGGDINEMGFSKQFYSQHIAQTFTGKLLQSLSETPNNNPEAIKLRQINQTTQQTYLALTQQYGAGNIAGTFVMIPDMLKNSVFYTVADGDLICVVYNYLTFRRHIHKYALLMAGLIISSTILILLIFPLYFRSSLVRPLKALLAGVKKVNAGDYTAAVPVKNDDEIGYLAESFNNMVQSVKSAEKQLQNYAAELEKKVDERTKDLQQKNQALEKTLGDLERALKELSETQDQLLLKGKMAALGNLVAGVAHEINNPIGAINSAADVSGRCILKIQSSVDGSISLDELRGSKPFSKSLKILKDNTGVTEIAGKRIAKIVLSLKNFARLDESVYQRANIQDGIESTLTLLEHQLRDRITVEKQYVDLPQINCAPGRLNQVFMNVLQNAIQAIDGEGKITISTAVNNQNIRVAFADTGSGIPPNVLKDIFDVGFRTDNKRVKMGTGLSTSYRIIQEHNGDIKLNSTEGNGTEVVITLPV